jgi:phosphoserine phosphatase
MIMRRVITLLNDHFDMDKRLYRSGWSDELIAKTAETSPEFVVTFRRSAYGELAEDPMISKLRDDVAALRELFEQEVHKLRAQFEPQLREVDYKLARLIGEHNKAAG